MRPDSSTGKGFGNNVKCITLTLALTESEIDDESVMDQINSEREPGFLAETFTTYQLCQTFNGQRQKIDAWIKVLKTTY